MKKLVLFLSILSCISFSLWAQESKQNDIIIAAETNEGKNYTRYYHYQNFMLGFQKNYTAYKNPDESETVFNLPYATPVLITEIEIQTNADTENSWYKIQYKDQSGWVKTDYNPYKNDNWSILGTEKSGTKEYTIRKISQKYIITPEHETLYLYEKPDSYSARIAQITEETVVEAEAITEETEIMKWSSNKSPEHWVKILFEGKEAWIFGTKLDSGRGGPKYPIPEKEIEWNLEWGEI